MKITFIYAYEKGETWSTPMALINEFKKRGWETDIISIGSNRTGQYHDRDLEKWINVLNLSNIEFDVKKYYDSTIINIDTTNSKTITCISIGISMWLEFDTNERFLNLYTTE